jgi:hypothetical protein
MINTRFGIEAGGANCILDYDDDIVQAIREIDEDATMVLLPSGESFPVSAFEGRTAGDDAEVEEDEYDALPIAYVSLGKG